MLGKKARRFWVEASVVDHGPAGYGLALDGREVKAPSRQGLRVPTRALAEALAAEWNAQGEEVDPAAMPLTQLANTAQDRIAPQREKILEELLDFVEGDVLCYRAVHPRELTLRQEAHWQPVLDWAGETFGACWRITQGITPVSQPAEVHAALRREIMALETLPLTAFQVVAPLCSSLVLGLAFVRGRITAEQAFDLAFLDELYQVEFWGEDHEAKKRRSGYQQELRQAEQFLKLGGGG